MIRVYFLIDEEDLALTHQHALITCHCSLFPPSQPQPDHDLVKCDKALQGKMASDLDSTHASMAAVLTRIITFIKR